MEAVYTAVAEQAPKAKRAHTKSRHGCKNCKARKVKCDETRPLCKNCERHYTNITECEWGDDPPKAPRPATADKPTRKPPFGLDSEEHIWAEDKMKILAALKIDEAGSRVVDPFNNLPPSEVSSVDQLVRKYIAAEPSISFPFFQSSSIMKAWWPFARDDIVLFHAILVLSDRKLGRKERIQETEKVHKMLAITKALLQERLRDPVLGIKDETIATVAHLAAIEHERGDVKSLKYHVNVLRRMVTMRGGLDEFKASCPLMANFTFWVALLTANDPLHMPNELRFLDTSVHCSLTRGFEPLRYDFAAVGIPSELVRLISDVDVLSQRFNTALRAKENSEETAKVISAVTVTVQRCLEFADRYESRDPTDAVCAAVALAGCASLVAPVGGAYPNSSHTIASLMNRLRIKLSVLLDAEMRSSPLLFWLLYSGSAGAFSSPDGDFFTRHVANVARDLCIRDWTTARETCVSVVWHAVFCESVFARVWLDVEERIRSLDSWDERMNLTMPV